MKTKKLLLTRCTMETTSWLLVIICMILVHTTNLSNCAPTVTEINSPDNDHAAGILPTATIAPTTMTPPPSSSSSPSTTTTSSIPTSRTIPMNSAKSWASQKPSRSKHITKSNVYKKPSPKDKGGRAKVPFLSPTLVPTTTRTGYDVEKNISRHKEATPTEAPAITTQLSTTVDTVVDNVNSPKDYSNKNTTNTSALRHFDSQHSLLGVSDILSTNANDDGASGKDIDFISDSRTTKADETHATTEGYHAKAPAARASSTTTMPASRVENPLSNTAAAVPIELGVVKSMNSSSSDFSPTYHQSKSMKVNASVSFQSSSTTTMTTTTTTVSPTTKLPDVGHDGVKVTKKKQLLDKHFIAASLSPSGSLHSSFQRKDNPWPMSSSSPTSTLSKTKPAKSNIGGGKKLMEVPNGYLGPIMMKEKTFSVSHPGKKPKPSLVEQKLKDKKLVEIIAPTALMEPISKVKNSQPDFVAIDVTTVASTTTTAAATTTTTTEKVETPTTIDINKKKKEVESETATTYFLVVTQDGQAMSNEKTMSPPVNPEMEPLNSGEIENTLREIYAEVINAMESGSRARTTSTEATVSTATFSTTSQKNGIPSDGSSPFDQEGTPETLHIFEQSFEKQTASATVSPSIDVSPIPIEQLTSSATNLEQKSATVKFLKNLTISEKNLEEDLPETDIASTRSPDIGPNAEQSETSSLAVTKGPEFVSSVETETITTEKSVLSEVSTVEKNFGSTEFYTTESSATKVIVVDSTLLRSGKKHQHIQSEPILLEVTSPKTLGLDNSTSSTTDRSDTSTSPTTNRSKEDHSTVGLESSTVQGSSPKTTDLSSTTMLPHMSTTQVSEPAESKISNIQIEVVDSTLQPIVAATNFKHNTNLDPTDKHLPIREHTQERFTQYVVDKSTDSATQESSSASRAPGKPEPAAIEIHINVSEGFGNESEDLEFLYRQSDFRKFPSKKPPNSLKPQFDALAVVPQNETSNEAAEEIVVEIIDTNPNSTENSGSRENLNVNPVFTFRSDDDSQVELKNVKYYPEDRPNNIKDGLKSTDDFFVPHVGEPSSSSSLSSSAGQKPLMDRDSDTIFYISNTEVKVGESLPTANIYDTQMKKSRLESQFFPANYEEHRNQPVPQRYEEDIILSPSPSKNGPLKVIRRPLDISYVGESIMEVEQVTLTSTVPAPLPSEPDAGSTPDVIIEPAVLPEMAIGVPVIGELPPQIELKEIDYMPNFDGNKEESSIQYGGDLIDEGGAMGVGFDMDSYPLGNLGGMGGNRDGVAISSQMFFNHRVNHLKKDVFSADVGGVSSENIGDGNDLLRQGNDSVVNGTAGNATAYSVFEDQIALNEIMHFLTPRTLLFAGIYTIIPLVLVIFLIFIWRDYNRKYKRNPFNAMGRNSSTDPLDAEKANGGGDGDGDGLETPEELRASSLAFGGATTANTPSLDICTDSNEATNGNASDGDGRNCNGSNSNSRTASDAMDLGEIKAYNSGDVHGENFTLTTVRCYNNVSPPQNQQKQQSISSNIPPQYTTTTNATAANTAVSGFAAHSAAAHTSSAGSSNGTKHSNNYSGPNGSITTMTLKNNHLIVETEERNDISRDTRVTKMHYNNSEKDGVFVVEVSRGADSKIMPSSPVTDEKRPFNIDADVKIVQSDTQALLPNHEKVQVHAPPPENLINHDDIDTNHLHQIDEVDEFEECPKFTKNSNTGLSQSDLSSSSSVDSNKRYSYGNQELYTIEQQDYTTPSPVATKAPHPHGESKHPQPENHNDDNGHAENGGHCLEKSPTKPTPKCADSSITPPPPPLQSSSSLSLSASSDKVHDVNGQQDRDSAVVVAVESKPKITAALLKQDTVIVNEVTNGLSHVINGNDEVTPQTPSAAVTDAVMDTNMSTEPFAVEIKTLPDYNSSSGGGINTENGFDSIISLPDPPSSDEIKQMNDIILMETNQLDSLPPPPPPENNNQHQHLNGNANCLSSLPFVGIKNQNGDSHSIVSESPTMQTPNKVMKPLVPPTITVADTSATTVHTNGNCLTGHPATAIAVEVSGSS